jgi:hypothetical protein
LSNVSEIAARRVRVLPIVAVVLGAVLVAQAVHELVGLGGDDLDTFFDQSVNNFLLGASSAACLARAWTAERGRLAWTLIGLSLAAFTVGDVISTILYSGAPNSPSATISDFFWLAYYPFVIAGLAFLIRDRFLSFDLHRWIDGIAAALIVIALAVGLVVQPVFDKSKQANTVGGVIQFIYPVFDVLILGAAIGIFALTAWRPGKTWLLVGLGLAVFAGADSVAAVQTVNGTFEAGTYDFVWAAGALLIAWAAWLPYPPRQPPALLVGWKAIALPILCQVLAAAVQIIAVFHHVPRSERLLTVAVLALVVVQLWISRPRKPV